jgi:hypothetical protein
MNTKLSPLNTPALEASPTEDLRLAASKMLGAERRSFPAAMPLKYGGGSARQAAVVFGWNRHTVALGLPESRTGVTCLGPHAVCCGNTLWEAKHPEVASALWGLAEAHSPPDPTFRTTRSYPRLTAAEALKQLRSLGCAEAVRPSPSTMAAVLNRNGYRRRPVVQAKPPTTSRKRTPSSPTSRQRTGKALRGARPSG